MKAEGFGPAAVIETSPGNFQAWLRHGVILDEAASTRAAKMLAERFGGDPGSADWRHFGRLAGFTNPKPHRRLASGLQPFARLVEANGQVYREAASFIAEVRAAMANEAAIAKAGNNAVGQGAQPPPPLKPLAEFHGDPRYAGDLHRADMAWAATPPLPDFLPARFEPRSCGGATFPKKAIRDGSANTLSAPLARRFARPSRVGELRGNVNHEPHVVVTKAF
jgi:hypothetical protein